MSDERRCVVFDGRALSRERVQSLFFCKAKSSLNKGLLYLYSLSGGAAFSLDTNYIVNHFTFTKFILVTEAIIRFTSRYTFFLP